MATATAPAPEPRQIGYNPTPPQRRFHNSEAFIRGYGGAMGGGKSRAICEDVLRNSIEHDGLVTLIARSAHTSIIQTTKREMVEKVLPKELIDSKKESGGEDWIRLFNGSIMHFIGLEDPVRWFSSEIGLLAFDEAHEIPEDTVTKLMTRLRQRCRDCIENDVPNCEHMPNRLMLSFNPDNPDHWIAKWFLDGASQSQFGYVKEHLRFDDAEESIGDTEFIFARPIDNPYLGERYLATLRGLRGALRDRYYEGKWVYISGDCFFDTDALSWYEGQLTTPWVVGKTGCCRKKLCTCTDRIGERPAIIEHKYGNWELWKKPVREHFDSKGIKRAAHRYIVSVDVSSGGSKDYSAIQVISVEDFEQVAEFKGKADPDLVAVEAARIARIYNDALVAPEITGGWGFSVVKELQRLKYPRIYMRPVEDRLAKKFTDKLGWDTTTKSRAVMLDTLERVLREREFKLNGRRTHRELGLFVRDDSGRPAAQPGANDDLTIALAIGVKLAADLPRQLRRVKHKDHVPTFSSTGW